MMMIYLVCSSIHHLYGIRRVIIVMGIETTSGRCRGEVMVSEYAEYFYFFKEVGNK